MVTVTEDLAYKHAKEADQLLSEGVYLGIFMCFLLIDESLSFLDHFRVLNLYAVSDDML